MARTNKQWIAKKKEQQAKQKKLIWTGSSIVEWIKKSYTNPKWHEYQRFYRSWKYLCDTTSQREDPDGFRILRKANGGEIEFKFYWDQAWWYRKYIRKTRRMSVK